MCHTLLDSVSRFTREKKSAKINSFEECSICYTEYRGNAIVLRCGHKFHRSCIYKWFRRSETCPYCRCQYPFGYYLAPLFYCNMSDHLRWLGEYFNSRATLRHRAQLICSFIYAMTFLSIVLLHAVFRRLRAWRRCAVRS